MVPIKEASIKAQQAKNSRDAIDGLVIENVFPEIDGGKYPAKCVIGESVLVEADIMKDGHDVIAAVVRYRKHSESEWHESPLSPLDNDRWRGSFVARENTFYLYTIEAWFDRMQTWSRNLEKKCIANVSIKSDLWEGAEFLKEIRAAAKPEDYEDLDKIQKSLLKLLQNPTSQAVELVRNPLFQKMMLKYPLKSQLTTYDKVLVLTVDRKRAEFSAWYEIFPRSQGKNPNQSATFKDCIARLPEIQKMGFDVLYLTPIHPIGSTNRKGPNNSLTPDKNSPGSPWAIGNKEGGHKAVHPELGTLKDFDDFVSAAEDHGLEIALDIAFQCSPDHPYVTEHPEWFYHLPDGTIRYAENPPKKYEDIYPFNFHCENWQELWNELESVFRFWIDHGVKIFRVDNPHTKPLRFWEWVIGRIQKDHPDTIFLSEAFTRPKIMKFLAKAGFTQSYTYFTWRNHKWEIKQYLEELTQSEMKAYFRGNFFANTPDILHEYLQKGGRPAFMIRLILAATLSSSYGIYSSFELCEGKAKAQGTEDYLDSEKYQFKVWDWNRTGNIKELIGQVNKIRNEQPALQLYKNLEFYDTRNDWILCYGKRTADNRNIVVCVVNLHPSHAHEDTISLPLWKFGINETTPYQVKDLLTGKVYTWKGPNNYVRLDPLTQPAHIFQIIK